MLVLRCIVRLSVRTRSKTNHQSTTSYSLYFIRFLNIVKFNFLVYLAARFRFSVTFLSLCCVRMALLLGPRFSI